LIALLTAGPALPTVLTAGILGSPAGRNLDPWSLGNYPNTAVQLSGNTTVTPDAAPTLAASISVSTSTNFKGRLEGEPITGVVRVTDAHPAGTYIVTVTAFDGGPSIKTFTLTVATPATCNPVTFAAATTFNLGFGATAYGVSVGDFNGDGNQDLVTAEELRNRISVSLGNGMGGFGVPTRFNVGSRPLSAAVGDFNGDGKQDLAVANHSSNNVSVLLGNGAGSFGAVTNFGAGTQAASVAVGDFNGDSRQDLAVANDGSNNVSILMGDGAGSFSAATNFAVGNGSGSVAIGDFNNDGKQDLSTANFFAANVSVLLGDGAGSFGAATNFSTSSGTNSIAVGDFNGDGKQDLATSNSGTTNVSVLLGNGVGGFGAANNFGTNTQSFSIAIGDFNGDGKQDLAVPSQLSNNVSIFLGDGAGGFGAATNFPSLATTTKTVVVGDFNGDGKQDLAMTNQGSDDVSVLLRQCPPNSISGRVVDDSGNALSGVVVTLSGSASSNTTTNAGGNYSFASVAANGNYTVTPSSSSCSFSPVNQTFSNLSIDRVANFVGTKTIVNLTGKVIDAGNNPINNVTLALTRNSVAAGTAQTNGSGDYTFGNLTAGANYVVTPIGTFTPSSQTFNNLTTNATANFKAAQSIPSQCNTASFAPASTFVAGTKPESVAVGDFNGDGKLDLAAANVDSANISIFLGTGTGSFSGATNFSVGTSPFSVAVGDFNRDGKLDLAAPNIDSNNVSILLGTGTGGFSAATNFIAGSGPKSVAVGDFNGDDKLDLAVANNFPGSNNVSILLGSGTGSFSAPTNFAVPGDFPQDVAAGDFNGDGKLDLVVPSDNVSILLGTGTGSFSAATTFVSCCPQSVAVGDFNGDGKLDLATPNGDPNDVSIFLGTGTGSFSAPTNFAAGTEPLSVAVGDFNGDGKLDLATASRASNDVSILLGTGTGSFGVATNFAAGIAREAARAVAVGDFNGDGKLDLAETDFISHNVSILLNNGASCNTQTSLSISGQIADAANRPLPDVTVTLSGPITRVMQTDVNGNYAFANLAPGGNYAVTVQSNYFVFGPSRADFFNLGSSQVANFQAAPLAVPSPTPSPNDDFTNTSRDASKWTIGAQTSSTTAFDPQVTTAQTNGQLVVTPLTQASGMHFAGYVSANSFDLRNGSTQVEVVKAGTGGVDTIFAVGADVDNFYRFMVHTPGTATILAPRARGRDGIERPLDATTAQLVFQVNVGGQLTSLAINYDPIQHRFMRFRHVPAMNSIVFETSPDNVMFTVQHTVVLQRSVAALTAELSAGTTNPANPGQTVFDNFGLVTSTFQFSAASYSIGEGDGSILVTVTRAGSLTDAATVDFATADGTARQKSKYTNAAGTLTFASGVASRTFRVLLVDNQLAEGEQSLNLLLTNPSGAGLNTPGRAVLTISDNDTTLATGNPLDDAQYFVTQHYYDFLNRVPDQGGLDFWKGQITQCGTDVQCLRTQRITVSNAFFYEQEYQQTGSYVVRLYRAAYGNNQPISNNDNNPNFPNENKKLVNYSVFSTDRARVRGGPSLAQTQLDLANAFVLRSQFLAKYPSTLNGPAYVDALIANIHTDIGVDLSSQRQALIDLFNQGGRGAVLYRIADDNTQTNPINNRGFIDAEYNRAFVLTQYFGYLRRNPDIGGYLFWLGQVNSAPLRALEKQRAMVCSFITSLEYQQRFSPVATHNNTECQ